MPEAEASTAGVILEIDGAMCGTVWSVRGGDGFAPVVVEPYSDPSKKHLEQPKWEDLELHFNCRFTAPFPTGSRPRGARNTSHGPSRSPRTTHH